MRLSHVVLLVIASWCLIACAQSVAAPVQDPYAPYRPALLPAYQGEFDHLPQLARYDLTLRVDFDTRYVEGRGVVSVPNRHPIPLSELYLRLYPNLPQYQGRMEVQQIAVDGKATLFDLTSDNTSLHVTLPQPLPPGQVATLAYTWTVSAPTAPAGYLLFGESQGLLSLPLSYPVLAVSEMGTTGQRLNWHLEVAPAHGDVAFTESALYQVDLTTAADVTLIAPGAVISQTTANGVATWRYATGPIREFAFWLARDFAQVSGRAYDTVVHSYFPAADREAGQRALEYAIAAVQVYSDRFGRYPFTQLSVVAAPLEYRGMEYPEVNLIGIDTYRRRRGDLEFLIAHEIAHQWWYNLVGNDPVARPWLDEGLAEYSTYIYYESVYGRERAEALRQNRWEIPVAYAKANGLDTIVGQPSSGFGPGNYETMVYAKSALFFHALRLAMGDDNFFELLRTLVIDYRYQVLTPDLLMEQAQKITGQNLEAVYREWILTAKKL